MQFSFLGFSSVKIMEFNLDVKDIVILKYFNDFKNSGKMKNEIIKGEKYYWISYQNIENEFPFLGLSKRAIMSRMLRMKKLEILKHYTKKDGGTFSYYALGEKFSELLFTYSNKENSKSEEAFEVDELEEVSKLNAKEKSNYIINKGIRFEDEGVDNYDEPIQNNEQRNALFDEFEHENVQGLSVNSDRGCALKERTKTNILNNNKTIVNNIYNNINNKVSNNIKYIVSNVLSYLNEKVGVNYKSTNTKIINLIKLRLKEGFNFEDFKIVIDKKIEMWKGTSFEQYLNPFTLFGDKFELYLNQKVIKDNIQKRRTRFDNFTGRTYDYDKLERQLLGWE